MSEMKPQAAPDALRIGSHTFSSRLIVGTGKYASHEGMRQALDISGTECITVAVRRERSANFWAQYRRNWPQA